MIPKSLSLKSTKYSFKANELEDFKIKRRKLLNEREEILKAYRMNRDALVLTNRQILIFKRYEEAREEKVYAIHYEEIEAMTTKEIEHEFYSDEIIYIWFKSNESTKLNFLGYGLASMIKKYAELYS